MTKKAALHNLGCKVNSYELDSIMKQLIEDGYEIVPFDQMADVYVVNTCSVTNIADRKSRQMLSRARKRNEKAVVVAVGCYVQTAKDEALKEAGIDLCIGNNHKGEFAAILKKYLDSREDAENKEAQLVKTDLSKEMTYDSMDVDDTLDHSRVFIKIQDGCNQFCTYCIIPYARGRVRSRKISDILNEIGNLTKKGFKEFVITGIHVSSYGTDFDYDDIKADRFGPEHILELLTKISQIDGVERIRLGSLEPRIITEDFLVKLTKITKICPHFHLSLQSGCDETLLRMNRHYTAEEFLEKCRLIRKYYDHPAITTDVIVGFPGETDNEFEISEEMLKKADFYEMHIFKYSKRAGTPAAVMKNQLTEKEKSVRSDKLELIEKECSLRFRQYYLGKEIEVLFEEKKLINDKEFWTGHTREYVKVIAESEENLSGIIRKVKAEYMFDDNHIYANIMP